MEFRKIAEGRYFPPVLPNGEFWGVPIGGKLDQLLFDVTDAGLKAAGVMYLWSEILGASFSPGDGILLLSENCPNGSLGFYRGCSTLRCADGGLVRRIDGYEVDYCLINRVHFEAKGKVRQAFKK